jgi:hypothetical protein
VTEDDIVGEITQIEIIARGTGVHIRQYLNRRYGYGKWRKLKGIALVHDDFGKVRLAEIHWFEAHGIGRRNFKRKEWLEEKR